MTTEEVEQQIRDALAHLYDPDYRPPETLYELTGCRAQAGMLPLQSAIIRAIESLQPPAEVRSGSRLGEIQDLLRNRFLLRLTLEETADRMYLSFSSTRRLQRAAIHALARTLWDRRQAPTQPPERQPREESTQALSGRKTSDAQAPDWRSQMERELASLQACAPDTTTDVAETIDAVLELVRPVLAKQEAHVEAKSVQADLSAAVHPSALRQALISALGRAARHSSTGQIELYAGLEEGNIRVTITTSIAVGSGLTHDDLVSDIVVPGGASIEALVDGAHAFLWLVAPSTGRVIVLVVDDNSDMVRFYRSATLGTCYHIVHLAQGQDLFQTIENSAPDVIVLDVMLPDVDGWQLLMRLHQDPTTRSIPVIVCTVVREEALALSLGAAHYLSKPVQWQEFTQALDQALLRAREADSTPEASR